MNVLVFGSRGLVGSSIVRELIKDDRKYNVISSSRQDTDLFSAEETKKKITISNPLLFISTKAVSTKLPKDLAMENSQAP